MKTSGLIILAMAALVFGHQDCKDSLEVISNLHGIMQLPSIETTITVCNSSVIVKNQPITLNSYQDYLKIKKNRMMTLIFGNTFSLLPNLKTLIASDIGLAGVDVDAFKGLINLQYLNLKKNNLENLNLNLKKNNLENIPPNLFDNTPNLIDLDLEDNKLREISEHQFDKLTNLKKLKLAKNQLTELPGQWHSSLQNLEYLSLSNNQLRIIRAGMFQGLPRLQTLRLEYNQIARIQEDGFSGLSSLNSLSLQYNANIQPDNVLDEFKKLGNLRGLSISPPGLKCEVLRQVIEWTNERGIDLVQIPAERRCW